MPESVGQNLMLEGRFVYLQFLAYEKRFFHIHLEFVMLNKSNIRLSVSNMFQSLKVSGNAI